MGIPTIGTMAGQEIPIIVEIIIAGRVLIQANSGAGKSWALRRLLEQTAGQIQHLIIDVEGEFHTLREKFLYVLARPGDGDCVANIRTAELLARKLLELNASAILDIYELKAHERLIFVRRFLDAMVNAPKKLWHPCIVVVDEAHIFCPQSGKAESMASVIDLMTRGRKRGFAGVLATQRISKLHKDAAAEANSKMVGRSVLDVDMRRSADELGFSSKDDQLSLRSLKPGFFYSFGPAFTGNVEMVQVGEVSTTHPRPGMGDIPETPPPEKVVEVLGKLKDVPQEAEQELREVDDLKNEIKKLRAETTRLKNREPVGKAAEVKTVVVEKDSGDKAAIDALQMIRKIADSAIDAGKPATSTQQRQAPAPKEPVVASEGVSGPEQRILNAVIWWETIGVPSPTKTQIAVVDGYSPGSGAFNNPCGRLRSAGLIDYPAGGLAALTDAGRDIAQAPDAPPTADDLHRMIMGIIQGPHQKILRVLLECWPEQIDKTDLALAAGYTPGSGAFNNPCGKLRSLGLIDYPAPGAARANDILFPGS